MSRSPRKPGTGAPSHSPGRRGVILRFVLGFGLLLGGFYALILLPWFDCALYAYLRLNAELSGVLLRFFGQPAQVNEVTIRAPDFAISVRRGCDAIEPAWFFCAAVLAFPAPWRRKPLPLAIGVTVLLVLNLVRISSLFVIGRKLPGLFATAHLEIWPALFILGAAGMWLRWIRQTTSPADPSSHAAP